MQEQERRKENGKLRRSHDSREPFRLLSDEKCMTHKNRRRTDYILESSENHCHIYIYYNIFIHKKHQSHLHTTNKEEPCHHV